MKEQIKILFHASFNLMPSFSGCFGSLVGNTRHRQLKESAKQKSFVGTHLDTIFTQSKVAISLSMKKSFFLLIFLSRIEFFKTKMKGFSMKNNRARKVVFQQKNVAVA